MTAPALAPPVAARSAPPGAGPARAGALERDLLLRFDSRGEIQWRNAAAREVLGPRSHVVGVLTAGGTQGATAPALSAFPLGREWLWLGAAGDSGARTQRIRQVNLSLLDLCRRRESGNLGLLRAQGRLEDHRYQRARRRLLLRAGARFIEAVEAERGRIARELHDDAGQSLAGILLNLEVVGRHLDSANTEVSARLARSRELASLTLDQIRRISHELHPPEWSEQDFGAALEWLVESMGLRARLRVEVGAVEVPKEISPTVKTILYRTVQEGLTNVLRHSGATRVAIRAVAAANGVRLVLEDDGQGFDASLRPARSGIGLANIRRRIESLGGKFEIHGASGRGVRLSAFVPVAQGAS